MDENNNHSERLLTNESPKNTSSKKSKTKSSMKSKRDNTSVSMASEDMRKLVQQQKKQLKENNYKIYLQRLEKAEQQKLDQQIFHKTYENTSYVSQVRLYKQVKNDLFNWGQLLSIVSDFILVISFILLGFIVLSMFLNSYPFVLSTAIN